MPPNAAKASRSSRAELLELITRETTSSRQPLGSVVIGIVKGIGKSGEPRIDFDANRSRADVSARSTLTLHPKDIGRQVVVAFEEGDPARPIVVGMLDRAEREQHVAGTVGEKLREVEIDGERIVFTAEQEIVLRCGEATITLTRAGKVLIRGTYLLSRSSGVNRIKGGSVQIN